METIQTATYHTYSVIVKMEKTDLMRLIIYFS